MLRTWLRPALAALGAALTAGVVTMTTGSAAGSVSGPAAQQQPAEEPPSIVEDYTYPGANKILQERGILLRKGDGNILLVECDNSGQLMEVWSRSKGKFCFRIAPRGGYLTLEVPEVYLAKGDDHAIQVAVAEKGSTKHYDVARNGWTSIGEGTDPDNGPATLLEIRAAA